MDTVTGYTDPRKLWDLSRIAHAVGYENRDREYSRLGNPEWKHVYFNLLAVDLGMDTVREYVKKKAARLGDHVDRGIKKLKNSFYELNGLAAIRFYRVPPFIPAGLGVFEVPETLGKNSYRELPEEIWEKINPPGISFSETLSDFDILPGLHHYTCPRDLMSGVEEQISKLTSIPVGKVALAKIDTKRIGIGRTGDRSFIMVCPSCGKVVKDTNGKARKSP